MIICYRYNPVSVYVGAQRKKMDSKDILVVGKFVLKIYLLEDKNCLNIKNLLNILWVIN